MTLEELRSEVIKFYTYAQEVYEIDSQGAYKHNLKIAYKRILGIINSLEETKKRREQW